ncbi:MAG TPA: MFS transporter [Tepidisphaeraceae bacterium]|nr:MFS transporter [Tepidisphaeraceae bacterium]
MTDTEGEPDPRSADAPKTWRVGSLVYSRAALFNVFFWMLWGDFCLTVMEAVIPRLVPLQLKSLGASSALIGLIIGSVPAGMNFVMNPIISTASDRHRGRLGRRMPFLLWPTPLLAICLVLVGFSPNFAHTIHSRVAPLASHMSEAQLAIALIAVLTICFTFFNLFITSVYYYLFVDVIPQAVMGKFTCLFRVVGSLGGIVFNRWILGWSETHSGAVYVSTGLLYLVAFLLLVWRVREGEYPAPEPIAAKGNRFGAIKVYMRECFSMPFYLKLFSINALFYTCWVPFNTFVIFYATNNLAMSRDGFGKVISWGQMLSIPLFFALGPIVDRFHPLRVVLAGFLMICAAGVLSFFFSGGPQSFLVVMLMFSVAQAIFAGGNASMLPRLLPRQSYGQFCSANAMFNALATVVAPFLCGALLDAAKDYRWVFLWASVFAGTGAFMTLMVLRHWKRLGGDAHYVPPSPAVVSSGAQAQPVVTQFAEEVASS